MLVISAFDMRDTCSKFDKIIYSNNNTQINLHTPRIDKCNHRR